MAEIPWLCFLGLPKRGRKIKAKKTENLKRDLPWLPAQAGAFSNQTKGLMPKRKKIEKGGKLGEEERKGVKEEEKEGWRKKEKIEKGGGREGEKGKERKGRRERLFSQLICLEIKNRTCTVGFLQPSGRELMEKIVQKNVADPW